SLAAWKMYLGEEYGTDKVSPYAAAARATDFRNLPPAFVSVGALDLFRDENIDYAQRLMAAGVPTDLQVYPGMIHGAEMSVPDAAVSRRMRTEYRDAMKRAIG
ncbi:MAG: alpha/beta hydrolase fold domain-containing protein, partial [Chloroflexota bacterium]|nr:alpha/beta hydrolase fold domain-containing protein [Chloroflexota bacterium]